MGVWIGNLDHRATDGITGSYGPALVLRAVFAELNRFRDTRPLYLSPRLIKADICRDSGLPADGHCASLSEWFLSGTEPQAATTGAADEKPVYLQHPTQQMQMAVDPRIPEERQAFLFRLANLPAGIPVDWYVDQKWVASTSTGAYLWPLQPGDHSVKARFRLTAAAPIQVTPEVRFTVK